MTARRRHDRPLPGYFVVRLHRHRPWVPAVIFSSCPAVLPDDLDWPYHPEWWFEPLDRTAYPLRAKIAEVVAEAQATTRNVWNWGHSIPAPAYAYMMARRAWARRWAPGSYEAQPVRLSRRWLSEEE